MTRSHFATLVLGAALAAAAATGAAAQSSTGEGVHVTAAQIAALVAKTTDGAVTAQLPAGPGTTMLAVRRDAAGVVEVHTRLNDEFVVQAGRATVLVGGTVSGAKETAPGEWRGGTLNGAHAYDLGPGDVLWIPAGAPHQTLVPKGGSFSYLAFKFDAKR